jgi:hypothetical protein
LLLLMDSIASELEGRRLKVGMVAL